MKVAVIGSRGLEVKNLEKYLPEQTSEIVSAEQEELTLRLGIMR